MAELEVLYQGVPDIVLVSTGGLVYPQSLDEPMGQRLLSDKECSMQSEESDCRMTRLQLP